ncbi:hypothetical protein Tco_1397080 [Tanacetum coccineum]
MVARWRSRVTSRPSSPSGSSSPTTSTLEIPAAPILPAPPTIIAPSTDIISPIVAPLGIGLDLAMQELYDRIYEIPVDRITNIEAGQRQLEAKSLIASRERANLFDHVAALERSNTRL